LGAAVGLSLIRELGPVLTALLATGRAGSATTAEIGTMVATEQLDALRMMSVDPIDLVATPRALAMTAVMPLLSALFIVCGLFVLAGLGAVAYLSLSVGGLSYGGPARMALYADFDEIGGLKPRAQIVISGVKVGQVSSITLDESYRARVRLDVDAALKLPIDT